MSKKQGKKKKQKIVYIDDGRTIADMSGTARSGGKKYFGRELKGGGNPLSSSISERMKTYFAAVRMMFLPMLAVIGAISVLFFLLWLLMGIPA